MKSNISDSNLCEVRYFFLASLPGLFFSFIYSTLDIEKELGVEEPPLLREHPTASLFDAAKLLIQTHARRVPLLDHDSETGHEIIVSVLTQYRLLKFISINVRTTPLTSKNLTLKLIIQFSYTYTLT